MTLGNTSTMRWFILLILILFAALALQAGLLVFAMYVLIGVLLLSRYLSKQWVSGLHAVRETVIHEVGHYFGLDDERIDELMEQ